jgi:hypothetical protein
MPVMGGRMEKLTQMTGNNNVFLSPDEKQMAILFSYSNKPWELYLKEAKAMHNQNNSLPARVRNLSLMTGEILSLSVSAQKMELWFQPGYISLLMLPIMALQ